MLQQVAKTVPGTAVEELVPLHPIGAAAARIHSVASPGGTLLYLAQTARRARDIVSVLEAFGPKVAVAYLPPWDCLPFDGAAPSRSAMGQRMGVLRWLLDEGNRPQVVVSTAEAVLRRVPPRRVWRDLHREFRVGDRIDADAIRQHLAHVGYVLDDRVDEPGEAAIRGRVLDLFPAAAAYPCRIEHDGERVTAIRSYDPVTQRTQAESDMLIVDPASEIVGDLSAREPFARRPDATLAKAYGTLDTVFDYLGPVSILAEDGVEHRALDFLRTVEENLADAGASSRHRPRAEATFLSAAEWEAVRDSGFDAVLTDPPEGEERAFFVPRFAERAHPWAALEEFLERRPEDATFVLAAPSEEVLRDWSRRVARRTGRKLEQASSWEDVVAGGGANRNWALRLPIAEGFLSADRRVAVVTAQDLGGSAVAVRSPAAAAFSLSDTDFSIGDAVVHLDHGVGILEGLDEVDHHGSPREVVRLRYADDATLLVPVREVGALWRYSGETSGVTLDRLKSNGWTDRRNAILQHVAVTAEKMLELARRRREARCRPVKLARREFERFCARFAYELSPDQSSAVEAVLADLASGRPMNRLVCGDVGFGKTEVALRATAAVAFAGRQVAFAAPTTVLAQQHTRLLQRRFSGFGIEIAHLSRMTSPAEAKRIKADLKSGKVRIVVGTHALCGKGVEFKDLGLVVADEEQRFGSRHKDALRRLGENVHTMTMTATPIPRTLQASFVGLNDLSIVATPPVLRQPTHTVLGAFDEERVREALERESRRGGQSFVVCPRVEDIEPMRKRLAKLVPDLSVGVVHGKLTPEEIDERMLAFTEGDGDILLATNIIESGLDVPAANTLIVWRPDRFGLAQLHQLRGRVGRGSRRGIVHLMTEDGSPLAPETERRLRTLEAMNRLGAGFDISARDLDIRGAGDLLGEEQAGHLQLVGLSLYRHFLERALRIAEGKPVRDEWTPDIALGIAGRVPADYVPDAETRLNLYAEIDRVKDTGALELAGRDVEDRFGPPPLALRALLRLAEIRLRCYDSGVGRLAAGPKGIAAVFRTRKAADEIRSRPLPADWKWVDNKLVYPVATAKMKERFAAADRLLRFVERN